MCPFHEALRVTWVILNVRTFNCAELRCFEAMYRRQELIKLQKVENFESEREEARLLVGLPAHAQEPDVEGTTFGKSFYAPVLTCRFTTGDWGECVTS